MNAVSVINVSQLNSYIKILFESDNNLQNLFVSGEISNFKNHYSSGHIYFSLKDNKSVIKVVMFSTNAQKLKFNLSDGMKVIVCGRVSLYEVSGQYQLYAFDIFLQGIGELYAKFEKLKQQLLSQGFFDESLKKPIPEFPNKIGVITSKTGAVIHDIKKVAERRYPLCEIILYPVDVQGEKASTQIVRGLKYFNKSLLVDTIIVGRGGGSLEELWAFNEEKVAKAVFDSNIPVVSAVGHETDFTICDFVSDKRASTPSVAAEIATPDRFALEITLNNLKERLIKSFQRQLSEYSEYLKISEVNLEKYSPRSFLEYSLKTLESLEKHLICSLKAKLSKKVYEYSLIKKKLESCSQESILKKGYTLILKEGKFVRDVKDIKDNSEVEIIFQNGSIKCKLIDVKYKEI